MVSRWNGGIPACVMLALACTQRPSPDGAAGQAPDGGVLFGQPEQLPDVGPVSVGENRAGSRLEPLFTTGPAGISVVSGWRDRQRRHDRQIDESGCDQGREAHSVMPPRPGRSRVHLHV
jgi:hypothetical protein